MKSVEGSGMSCLRGGSCLCLTDWSDWSVWQSDWVTVCLSLETFENAEERKNTRGKREREGEEKERRSKWRCKKEKREGLWKIQHDDSPLFFHVKRSSCPRRLPHLSAMSSKPQTQHWRPPFLLSRRAARLVFKVQLRAPWPLIARHEKEKKDFKEIEQIGFGHPALLWYLL